MGTRNCNGNANNILSGHNAKRVTESDIAAFRKAAADLHLSEDKITALLDSPESAEIFPDLGELGEAEGEAEPGTLEHLARVAQSRAERRGEQLTAEQAHGRTLDTALR